MPSLSSRLETLEQSCLHSGSRPAGMSDEQFLRYLSEMPRPQHALFMRAISRADLGAVINYGNAALASNMPAVQFAQFITAYENGDLNTSISILKTHIDCTNATEQQHAKP